MILKITNRDGFLNNFLLPLSKVTESAVLTVAEKKITSLISTSDNTVIVNAVYNDDNINVAKTLNIPDIKKFCRIIQCIDVQSFDLDISSNNISFSSKAVRFKYHLYDDNIISVPKLNLSKLDKLDFDGEFTLTHPSIIALIKGSTIATDTSKIYISVNDNELLGELTDKTRANTDSYGLIVSEDYQGTQFSTAIPLNFEIFRIISSIKFDTIKGKLVSTMGVMKFDMHTEDTQLTFVISALAN